MTTWFLAPSEELQCSSQNFKNARVPEEKEKKYEKQNISDLPLFCEAGIGVIGWSTSPYLARNVDRSFWLKYWPEQRQTEVG